MNKEKLDNFLQKYIDDEYSNRVLREFDSIFREIKIPDLGPLENYLSNFDITDFSIFMDPELLKKENIEQFLIKAINEKQSDDIILGAIYLLQKIATDNSIKIIIQMLGHKNKDIVLQAINGLGQIKDKRTIDFLIKKLSNKNKDIKNEVIWALGEIGEQKALPYILKFINEKDYIVEISNSLAKFNNNSVVKILNKLLNYKNGIVRANCIYGLGKLKDKSSAKDIIKKLDDPISKVSDIAAYSLGEIGDKSAIIPLIEKLREGIIDEETIIKAVVKIIKANGNMLPQSLIKYFYDDDFFIRSSIIRITGEVGDKRVLKPLIEIIKESDVIMLDEIIQALVKLADQDTVVKLYELLEDSDDMIKKTIKKTFDEIGYSKLSAYLIDSYKTSKEKINNLIENFKKAGKNTKKLLIDAMQNDDIFVVSCSIKALSKFKDPQIERMLISKLYDKEAVIRQSAAYSLGKLKSRISLIHLEKTLSKETDQNVKIELINTLTTLKISSSIPYLINIIKSQKEDMIVKLRASDALIGYGSIITNDVIALIDSDDDFVKETSSYILGKLGGDETVMTLSSLLKDKNISVSNMAGHSLSEIASPLSILPMIIAFKEKKIREDSFYKYFINLAQTDCSIIFDFINDAGEFSGLIIRAVGDSKNKSSVPFLINMLKNKKNERDVIMALGLLKDESSLEIIKSYLNSNNKDLANIAKWSIENFKKITKNHKEIT